MYAQAASCVKKPALLSLFCQFLWACLLLPLPSKKPLIVPKKKTLFRIVTHAWCWWHVRSLLRLSCLLLSGCLVSSDSQCLGRGQEGVNKFTSKTVSPSVISSVIASSCTCAMTSAGTCAMTSSGTCAMTSTGTCAMTSAGTCAMTSACTCTMTSSSVSACYCLVKQIFGSKTHLSAKPRWNTQILGVNYNNDEKLAGKIVEK